ncbi:hypothetical protein BGU41_00030 [Clostridioides difficile]|nr:hypothetical protein BGU41_00030 [Clostridioides difficile]
MVADSLKDEKVYITSKERECYYTVVKFLRTKGRKVQKAYCQSSYVFSNNRNRRWNCVRSGIAVSGVLRTPNDTSKLQLELRAVLSLKSKVSLIRKIQKDESFGYGRVDSASRDSVIAILSSGYADGIPRNLSCGKS